MQFYGKALNAKGRIAQVLVTKEPGKPMRQEFTGKIYRSDREADHDLVALNTEIARKRRSFERMLCN